MTNKNEEPREQNEGEQDPTPPSVDDGDVYFFNPWDRWIAEDLKSRLHSFEFD